MRGSKREIKPGVWELVCDEGRDLITGERRRRWKTFRGTARDADEALARLVAGTVGGREVGTDTTVRVLLGAWLTHCETVDLSPMTLREYRRLVDKRLVPTFGDRRARDVTARHLDAYYTRLLGEGLSAASIRRVHAVVSKSFGQAVKWGWLDRNPARDASPPPVRRRDQVPPPRKTVHKLLCCADTDDPQLGVFLRLAAATGARRGELCGLQWGDVVDGVWVLRRSVASAPGGTTVKAPKSHRSRDVPLDPATVALLDGWRAKCRSEVWVFPGRTPDRPWYPDTVNHRYRLLLRRYGFPAIRIHDLRHLHASWLLQRNVAVPTVAKRLGHADGWVTLAIYGHSIDDADRAAADVAGAMFDDWGAA